MGERRRHLQLGVAASPDARAGNAQAGALASRCEVSDVLSRCARNLPASTKDDPASAGPASRLVAVGVGIVDRVAAAYRAPLPFAAGRARRQVPGGGDIERVDGSRTAIGAGRCVAAGGHGSAMICSFGAGFAGLRRTRRRRWSSHTRHPHPQLARRMRVQPRGIATADVLCHARRAPQGSHTPAREATRSRSRSLSVRLRRR
jgi:hypothetical protein